MSPKTYDRLNTKPKENTRILMTASALLGWLLGVVMNGVFNFASDSPAFQLYPFCVVVCGFIYLGTALLVIRHTNVPWLFMVATALCIGAFVGTSVLVDRKEDRTKPPHLKLILKSTGNWPKLDVEFTNSFLFFKELQVMSTLDAVEHLVVPFKPGQSNESLKFALVRDSRARCDIAEVVISVPKDMKWQVSEGWSESRFPAVNEQFAKAAGTKLDLRALLANDWMDLPLLTFYRDPSAPNIVYPIHIRIRGEEMQSVFCTFWLSFPILTNGPKPRVVIGEKMTAGEVKIPWGPN